MCQILLKLRLALAIGLISALGVAGCVSGSSDSNKQPTAPPETTPSSETTSLPEATLLPATTPPTETISSPETTASHQAPPPPESSSPANEGATAEAFPGFGEMERMAELYYVAPEGAGEEDGSSPANAVPIARLESFVRGLDHSAKLLFTRGDYSITGTLDLQSASPESLLVLEGEEGAVIHGNFDFATSHGTATGFRLKSGSIVIRGLSFRHLGTCVRADKYSVVDRVLIENIDAQAVHSCIVVDRDVQQEVSRWIIRDSSIQGYYRVGVRLAGVMSHDFVVDNLLIDGAHSFGRDYCYKSGIQLLKGVSNVQVKNSTIMNNIGQCDGYRQGEAIEADHKNGIPTNLRFENLTVANSGDADFDLKADQVKLSNITALGGSLTRYAFKVWSYSYLCENCKASGARVAYVNLNKAQMRFVNASFRNHKPVHVCDLRHGAAEEDRSAAFFENSQIYIDNDDWLNDCGEGALADVARLPMGLEPLP